MATSANAIIARLMAISIRVKAASSRFRPGLEEKPAKLEVGEEKEDEDEIEFEHPTSNIEHRTSNGFRLERSLDVGRWMLDVGC
jgi:hypothetical protein